MYIYVVGEVKCHRGFNIYQNKTDIIIVALEAWDDFFTSYFPLFQLIEEGTLERILQP